MDSWMSLAQIDEIADGVDVVGVYLVSLIDRRGVQSGMDDGVDGAFSGGVEEKLVYPSWPNEIDLCNCQAFTFCHGKVGCWVTRYCQDVSDS